MSYTVKMRVESYDVQPNRNIKISSLLKYLQKAAGDDADRSPLSYNALANIGVAFVLTKMNLKIISDIKLYDEITIITHARKTHGASFPRDSIVYVGNRVVAYASSIWVLLDLNKRSIVRPTSIEKSLGTLIFSDEDQFEISDIRRIVDVSTLLRTSVHTVKYSQLDMNKHLNNTFYSDIIFDCFDENNLHSSDAGLYMQINYKSEARFNDVLSIHWDNLESESFDFIALNEKDSKVCFSAYLEYLKSEE